MLETWTIIMSLVWTMLCKQYSPSLQTDILQLCHGKLWKNIYICHVTVCEIHKHHVKELWVVCESLSNKTPVPSWCRGRSSPCTRCCRPSSSPAPRRCRTWWTPGWAGSPWGRSSPARTRIAITEARLWSVIMTCYLYWLLRGQVQTGVASHVLKTYSFSKSNCYFSKRRLQTSEHLS